MSQCGGAYNRLLDSDDVLEPGSLESEFEFGVRMEADIVCSGWGLLGVGKDEKLVDASRTVFEAPGMHPLPEVLLEGKAVPTSVALYRSRFISSLKWKAE